MIGTVAELWRFPVKSMLGERIEEVDVKDGGLAGDRTWALWDEETGKVVSAKDVKRFPDLFAYRAACVVPPRAGEGSPTVRITLPDGGTTTSDDPDVDRVLSDALGRPVRLIARDAPDAPEDFFDALPLSLVAASTLARLEEASPESRFDVRRFRKNLVVSGEIGPYAENDWRDRTLAVGDALRLDVVMPVPRCVMTTLAQEELPRDPGILKTAARENTVDLPQLGALPCVGAYARVAAAGPLRVGDAVRLA